MANYLSAGAGVSRYFDTAIAGGFHVRSPGGRMDGGVCLGHYRRITMSAIHREMTRLRLIGYSINSCDLPSYIVIDQNALTGGRSPFAKVIV